MKPMSIKKQMLKAAATLLLGLAFALPTHAQLAVQVGTGTDETQEMPLNTCMGFNYSQFIYTVEQLTDAGIPAGAATISSIRFNITEYPGEIENWNEWKVYMTNTTETEFTTDFGWIDPASFTEVFDGIITASGEGWFEITLTTPFEWNGTDNLALAVSENVENWNCTAIFQMTEVDDNQSMNFNRDDLEIDPMDPTDGDPGDCDRMSLIPNIKFIVTPTAACAGTVTAGTVSSPESICAGTPFGVITEGSTLGDGITAQWQSAPAATGPWTNIAGAATTEVYMTGGIAAPTFFRYYLSCATGAASDTSDAIEVGVNPGSECYCTPTPEWGCGPIIDDFVTTGGVDNISNLGTGCEDDGYSDYTDQFITAYQGTIFNFELTTDPFGWNGMIKIWVDWNQDGIFDESENVYTSADWIDAGETVTGSYEIPLSAVVGDTRMRVRILSSDDFDACGFTENSGESEDYKFTVVLADPCDEVAFSDVTVDGPESICAMHGFTVVSDGTPVASGITRIWQSRTPAGTGAWTDIAGAEGLNYVAAGISDATDYRYIITCEASGDTDTSNVLTVNINPPTECYCEPEYGNGCEFGVAISHFILESIDNNTEGECSMDPLGLSNYQEMSTDLMQGVPYIAQVAASGETQVGYAFWIDYNDDGFFDDATERAATVMSVPWETSGDLYSVEMLIPADAPLGEHRLRVRMGAWEDGYFIDPCAFIWDGEAEDYSVNIIPKPSCADITLPATAVAEILPAQRCGPGNVLLNLTETMPISSGLTYQWRKSATAGGTYTAIGTPTDNPILINAITTTTFFKCEIYCEGELAITTAAVEVPVITPVLEEANDGANCGPGTVMLSAESNDGALVRWYTTPAGGMPVAEGNDFTTPVLGATTPYYVVAAGGAGPAVDTLVVGTSMISSWEPVSPYNHDGGGFKHQYLVKGSELTAMGIQPGDITSLAFVVSGSSGTEYNGFSIKMAPTTVNSMPTAFVAGTFTDVFDAASVTTTSGANNYIFDTPFEWDGLSNVIVQVCWSNGDWGTTTNVRYHNTTFPSHFYGSSDEATPEEVCTAPENEGGIQFQRPNMIFSSFSGCETPRSEVLAIINPVPTQPFVATDTTACGDQEQSITLNAANPGSEYLWSSGATTQTLKVIASGTYSVTVTNEFDCSITDAINVNLLPKPIVNLGKDTTFCAGGTLVLNAANPGAGYYWSDGSDEQTLTVDAAGTYRVIVENSSGCITGDTINVTIAGIIPTIDGIIVDNLSENTFSFDPLNPENVGTYTWDFGDGSPVSNAEAPTHEYGTSGTYTVTLTLESECGTFVHTTTISILGVNNPDIDNNILSLYPNPARETATIENKGNIKLQEVTVLNILGQVMYSEKATNNEKHQLDLSRYASGVYTVRILTDKGFVVRKFEIVK